MNNDIEIWKPVPFLPEFQASSWGRVMMTPWQRPMPKGGVKTEGGKPLVGQWDSSRYIIVFRGKTYKVHQMVCAAFHGEKPFPEAMVLHEDENSRNNRPENLLWGTAKQNQNYPKLKAKHRARTGFNSPTFKGLMRKFWAETRLLD
ncbi:HNH endonuclease signature motif containing protein [Microvirga yunnanensis]|uniref:HNH endonuclease signature motif containing protein n=1 Tax=Microvirga yunnanensis TaxID=2953740 RepID=UPI0021C71040|nr:HNH endonuclease signature motif containing protein [Microvirga sp. HBU67655]